MFNGTIYSKLVDIIWKNTIVLIEQVYFGHLGYVCKRRYYVIIMCAGRQQVILFLSQTYMPWELVVHQVFCANVGCLLHNVIATM